MRAKTLIEMHYGYWTYIEASVLGDLLLHNKDIPPKARRRIAYNAAFYATSEFHKRLQFYRKLKKVPK